MTTNYEIEAFFQKLGDSRWGGVFMKDELKNLSLEDKAYIVNLENTNQPGSHWVSIIGFTKCPLYVDPYGISPEYRYMRPFMNIDSFDDGLDLDDTDRNEDIVRKIKL
jgi:hypothetical protein